MMREEGPHLFCLLIVDSPGFAPVWSIGITIIPTLLPDQVESEDRENSKVNLGSHFYSVVARD